ncbi:MAG: prepilin-type N-terminal cleavage/methylation domain-containing protein [Gemmatimonadota bacterium]
MRNLPKREGFTLIELLIVIVIISILATIAISAFWRIKNRGFEASLQSDLRNLAIQQEQYFEFYQEYADSPDDLTLLEQSPGVTVLINYAAADGWAGVATHLSMPDRHCGMLIGDAPVGDGGPADTPGRVQCGDQ